jgi:hypothetical protein
MRVALVLVALTSAARADHLHEAELDVADAEAALQRAQAALARAQTDVVPPPAVAVAVASPTGQPWPGPRAGALALEVSLPTDFTLTPATTVIGVAGVGLGVGYRATRRFLVGATAEFEALDETSGVAGPSTRLRGGVETRYHFAVRPFFTAALGLRAGYETLDFGATRGAYADVSVGTDFWISRHRIGLYAAVGVDAEPAGAYGTASTSAIARTSQPAPMPGVPDATALYFAIGWRYGFR